MTQCIKLTPVTEISVFLDPLNAKEKNLILFALNDHEHCESEGGSHWSLLVYSKVESVVYHLNSLPGINNKQAEEFGDKILKFFKSSKQQFIEQPCIRQINGYDCGIHVLCNAQNVLDHFIKLHKVEGIPLCSEDFVNNFRGYLLKLIIKICRKNMS